MERVLWGSATATAVLSLAVLQEGLSHLVVLKEEIHGYKILKSTVLWKLFSKVPSIAHVFQAQPGKAVASLLHQVAATFQLLQVPGCVDKYKMFR